MEVTHFIPFQTKESEYRPKINTNTASEKDIKTNLNLGTKFQQTQKKFSGESSNSSDIDIDLDNIYKSTIQSGSNSVKVLSSKFDYRDNKEVENTEAELKRVVNEQKKQICNLKDQVEKERERFINSDIVFTEKNRFVI